MIFFPEKSYNIPIAKKLLAQNCDKLLPIYVTNSLETDNGNIKKTDLI